MATHRKKRIPKLCYTKLRGIGWHVAIRDPVTGLPRKIRFGNVEKRKAEKLYHEWLAEHLSHNRVEFCAANEALAHRLRDDLVQLILRDALRARHVNQRSQWFGHAESLALLSFV